MGSNSCFSKIIADVFPPWHRVNTHLDAAQQQTDKKRCSHLICVVQSEVIRRFETLKQDELLFSHITDKISKNPPKSWIYRTDFEGRNCTERLLIWLLFIIDVHRCTFKEITSLHKKGGSVC